LTRNLTLITAKRYVALLRRHDLPIVEAWLFGPDGNGIETTDAAIDLALVFESYEDTMENKLALKKLRCEVDERIEPHPFDRNDFTPGNPLTDLIRATGIPLK
jgi:hypothetical protein